MTHHIIFETDGKEDRFEVFGGLAAAEVAARLWLLTPISAGYIVFHQRGTQEWVLEHPNTSIVTRMHIERVDYRN